MTTQLQTAINTQIHPTALVDATAILGANVVIGPFCIVGPHCHLGEGCVLESGVVLKNYVRLGQHVRCHHGVVLGDDPQDAKFKGETSWVIVGEHTLLREYVTIHRGTGEGSQTSVGSHCLLMANSHVGHNSVVGNHVTTANAVLLAGHVSVGNSVVIGGGTAIHQHCSVGDYCMVGGGSRLRQNLPPYTLADGDELVGLNMVGLKRGGFSPLQRKQIRMAIKMLCFTHAPLGKRIEALEAHFPNNEEVARLLAFTSGMSNRGLVGASATLKHFELEQLVALHRAGKDAEEDV